MCNYEQSALRGTCGYPFTRCGEVLAQPYKNARIFEKPNPKEGSRILKKKKTKKKQKYIKAHRKGITVSLIFCNQSQ